MKHFHHKILAVAAVIVGLAFVVAYSFRFSTWAPTMPPTARDTSPPAAQAEAEAVSGARGAPGTPTPDAGTEKPVQGTPTGGQSPKMVTVPYPLTNALERVTKKTFGLYVTRKNSPVQPERFAGYHCGVDFETTLEEKDTDVVVNAICDGPLALKKTASGYGGVAVQRCRLGAEDVTVIYGHLRLTSVTANVGDALKSGQRLGLLGTGFSKETDGERKHLHLGIHKGKDISISGYVQTKAELVHWIDALTILR
jgi:murein DD-endopeptidase MepM/ murein hydrolase activator NlpD